MKKLICLLSLLSCLSVQYGCESHHQKEGIQGQQAQEQQEYENEQLQRFGTPQPVPEHGGAAGNR